jgi:hypothetical protein
MNDLQRELLRSYEQHPNFCFAQEAFKLETSRLAEFNDAYSIVHAYGRAFTNSQFRACKKTCIETLTMVFADLEAQTNEPYELRFLQELQTECKRLLMEELEHFHSKLMIRRLSLGNTTTQRDALNLHNDRFFLGTLSAETVQQILDIGAPELSAFRESARGGRVTREDLSVNRGPRIRDILTILNREYHRQGVLDSVSAYMGRRTYVTGAALELSVPQATWWANSFERLSRAPMTLYAHVDESVVYPKAIVYLSDVDRTNGATSCFVGVYDALSPNPLQALVGRTLTHVGNRDSSPLRAYYAKQYHQSMSSQRFRSHFMRLPREIRFNSHFGWDICPESGIEKYMVDREHFVIGKQGTYIVFDGARLLHRGGLLEQGERVALQVVFSTAGAIRRIARAVKRVVM